MDILLLIIVFAISTVAQIYVFLTYSKYNKIQNKRELSGFEVARAILDDYGLNNIYVVEVKGTLTDHYDARRKVVRLSSAVFNNETIASVAVAAHEAGHAIQDKENYGFMRFRGTMIPLVNFCSYAGYIAILIGLFFADAMLLQLGIGLEAIILLFNLITLPIEIDASKKAMKEIKKNKFLLNKETVGLESLLRASALTYVASLVATIVQIFRLVFIAGNMDKKNRR